MRPIESIKYQRTCNKGLLGMKQFGQNAYVRGYKCIMKIQRTVGEDFQTFIVVAENTFGNASFQVRLQHTGKGTLIWSEFVKIKESAYFHPKRTFF